MNIDEFRCCFTSKLITSAKNYILRWVVAIEGIFHLKVQVDSRPILHKLQGEFGKIKGKPFKNQEDLEGIHGKKLN